MFARFILLLLPLIAMGSQVISSSKLRTEAGFVKKSSKTLSVVGTFPSSPVYAIGTMYGTSTCSTAVGSASLLMNTCLSNGATSVKFSCSGNTVSSQAYSDTTCTSTFGSATPMYSTCSSVNPFLASTGSGEVYLSTYVTVSSCTATAPTTTTGGANVWTSEYADAACTQAIQSFGLVNGYCYLMEGGGSAMTSWPNGNIYVSNTVCSGTADFSGSIGTTCDAIGSTGDATTNGAYNQFSSTVSAAPQNMHLGMGILMSVFMVFYQLFSN